MPFGHRHTNRGSLPALFNVGVGMLSLVRFGRWASGWTAEIIVSPMTAAHPTSNTISMGATMWGRAPAGGGGTISGSRRKRRRGAASAR